ncbi:hypothetical protein Mapa_008281 [Marchantia paleacea]|nr:hypothetical protein Mapa_008281 [Marchantia paleacea]
MAKRICIYSQQNQLANLALEGRELELCIVLLQLEKTLRNIRTFPSAMCTYNYRTTARLLMVQGHIHSQGVDSTQAFTPIMCVHIISLNINR